jgi:hypothetical protein
MKKICGDTNLNRVPHEQVRKLSKYSTPEGIRTEDLTHQLCNPLPLEDMFPSLQKIEVHRGLEPATWRKGVGLLYH